MREVKFRAWSESFREYTMFYDVEMMIKEDGVWWLCNNKTRMFQLTSRTHKLMQFTGLKDKNGVEIYEGDVVKIETGVSEKVESIIWESKQSHFTTSDATTWALGIYMPPLFNKNTIEVIGNIYQHPELLTNK